jgi:aryl-alcohol dehydrogenase-like predicted oxidoreductase
MQYRMQHRFLGNTGLKISELVLGTQTFGWGADKKQAFSMADRYADSGGNVFDTADIYNGGLAESMLGSWLAERRERDRWVVATKVFFPTGDGPNDSGLSRKHIMASMEQSLRRLGTEYVDLYQMHCCDRSTPLEETLRCLDDLVTSGKVRYLGASNFTASILMKAIGMSRTNRWSPLVSLQAEYSLIVRSSEWELLPLCSQEGLGVLAWSPLAGGWLSGKYRKGQPAPPDSRVGRQDRWDDQPEQRESDLTWRVVEALDKVAEHRGKSPAQVALRWLLQKPGVTAPIVGARTLEQLTDNLGCLDWKLSAEELGALDRASEVGLPYPYRFVERYTRKR